MGVTAKFAACWRHNETPKKNSSSASVWFLQVSGKDVSYGVIPSLGTVKETQVSY